MSILPVDAGAFSVNDRPDSGPTNSSDTPVQGDIVVHKQHRQGNEYVLMPFQQASQVTWHSYAEAVEHAVKFAAQRAVDAWYTEDGSTYRALASHRRRSAGKRSFRES